MEFIDPPVNTRAERSAQWRAKVFALQANPGQWAKVGNYSPGIATAIRRGHNKAFLEGKPDSEPSDLWMTRCWEVTTKKTDDGKRNDVYVRWIGS